MTLKFTTYFDNNYLVKFYTLYQSLEKNCDDFHIYALTLNELDNKDVFKEKKKYNIY